ncbi:MAG: DUF72 domain-containing protein [Acidobacteria bacterium]|nr:DUF72 domain-containing protein [Acidobacteriota bacterium]
MAEVLIGPAGWAYKDWEGIVYPRGLAAVRPAKRREHPLDFLAHYFDLVEINTSFYGHMKPEVARGWVQLVSAVNPRFRFTAKLNRAFTHSPVAVVEPTSALTIRPGSDDEPLAKAGLDVLAGEGRLGAVLAQFPISFRCTTANRQYVAELASRFSEYPLVVELRHASWNNRETLAELAALGIALCNIDQPLIGNALGPETHVTSRIGYVRLHGRNYAQWFAHEHAHDRYNYLYTPAELRKWAARIREVAGNADRVFVVANNHFQGKAAANALELKSMIAGERVSAPESLVERYQDLREFVA